MGRPEDEADDPFRAYHRACRRTLWCQAGLVGAFASFLLAAGLDRLDRGFATVVAVLAIPVGVGFGLAATAARIALADFRCPCCDRRFAVRYVWIDPAMKCVHCRFRPTAARAVKSWREDEIAG